MSRTSSTMARTGLKPSAMTEDGGTKLYGVSGKVKRPGLWELPLGTTVREVLEEHAGGMRDGYDIPRSVAWRRFHRFSGRRAPGCEVDFSHCQKAGSRLGTGTHDRAGRSDLPGRHGAQSGTVLCPRIVRVVYPLP